MRPVREVTLQAATLELTSLNGSSPPASVMIGNTIAGVSHAVLPNLETSLIGSTKLGPRLLTDYNAEMPQLARTGRLLRSDGTPLC